MGGCLMASFEYEGREVKVIPFWELTLGDLQFMREHFDVAGQLEREQGLGDVEPNAWRAILVASIRQVEPGVDPKKARLDHVAIVPIMLVMNDEQIAEEERREAAKAANARPTKRSKQSRARSGASN